MSSDCSPSFQECHENRQKPLQHLIIGLFKNILEATVNSGEEGKEGWIVGKPAILLHTSDSGDSWERIPLSAELPGDMVYIKATGEKSAEMVTDEGAIYVTSNRGYNWKAAVQETVSATLNRMVSSGISGASYYTGTFNTVNRSPEGNYVAVSSRGNFYLTWEPGQRERVEQSLLEQDTSHSIVCDNLKKVYLGRDGNPEKFAVRGLSLALTQGECFGMLGPNGAGKTSFINMMIGLVKPSSGTAYVQGLDIRTNMDQIYGNMGVCPQHDLLWETLTGREHLLFYGRLKNLKGSILTQAVEESLRSVNLFNGGVADKQAGKYSGGMKRRLSVAISLIGDPKVVYMDEPSTRLDPASRNNLWNVVKRAKQNRAIILTTHSMEEAEHLCVRLGIFVDGSLQCVGNPKELKGRYGGSYVFTMTTSSDHETDVENLAKGLSPNANKIYQISGTQKFELPKEAIKIADVFRAVEYAKSRFTVQAWGLADTTLEDVFIKVAREAQPFEVLS